MYMIYIFSFIYDSLIKASLEQNNIQLAKDTFTFWSASADIANQPFEEIQFTKHFQKLLKL